MKYFKKYITYTYKLLAASRILFVHLTPALLFSRSIVKTPSNIYGKVFLRVQLTTLSRELFAQRQSIFDAWRGFEYAYVQAASKNVLSHHTKRLMRYFQFLYGSGIICFLWIFQKNCIDNISSKSQIRQGLVAFILVNTIQYPRTPKNNIYHSNKFHHFFNTNRVFGHVLIHSFDKIRVLVVTVELIWLLFLNVFSFNYVRTPNKFLLG